MWRIAALFALSAALPGWAQYDYPASASRILYFAQLADGGPVEQKWTTTVTLTNPKTTQAASVKLNFYGDDGAPLPLDLGQGPIAALDVTVPAGGVSSVSSSGALAEQRVGWAIATSDSPITGTVNYRATHKGVPLFDVAAPGSGSTFFFNSYANARLGVAVANPLKSQSIRVRATLRNNVGSLVSGPYYDITLSPLSHTTFNVFGTFTGPAESFTGSITITPLDNPPQPFVAWSVSANNNLLSPLPPGEMLSPGPNDRRPYDIAYRARKAGIDLISQSSPYLDTVPAFTLAEYVSGMEFVVDNDSSIRAYYNPEDGDIHVTVGMIEMLGSSDAALAFIIGHTTAHGVMARTGIPPTGFFANDEEALADAVGEGTVLTGGFDPGGAADFFGRMLYAYTQGLNVQTAVRTEFGIPNGFPARLRETLELHTGPVSGQFDAESGLRESAELLAPAQSTADTVTPRATAYR